VIQFDAFAQTGTVTVLLLAVTRSLALFLGLA